MCISAFTRQSYWIIFHFIVSVILIKWHSFPASFEKENFTNCYLSSWSLINVCHATQYFLVTVSWITLVILWIKNTFSGVLLVRKCFFLFPCLKTVLVLECFNYFLLNSRIILQSCWTDPHACTYRSFDSLTKSSLSCSLPNCLPYHCFVRNGVKIHWAAAYLTVYR
jgi:hypothetical protein